LQRVYFEFELRDVQEKERRGLSAFETNGSFQSALNHLLFRSAYSSDIPSHSNVQLRMAPGVWLCVGKASDDPGWNPSRFRRTCLQAAKNSPITSNRDFRPCHSSCMRRDDIFAFSGVPRVVLGPAGGVLSTRRSVQNGPNSSALTSLY
jgi:hypothetical protein